MGRTAPLTREQLQGRKDKAVRFTRDVVGDAARADEIEDESLESYAERRKLKLENGASKDERMPREMDQRAWQEGYDAGMRGERVSDCPYRAGTVERWSWSSGFVEGKAARWNPAGNADHDATIGQAVEILQAAYTPRSTRSDLVRAVGAALELLRSCDDDQAA